MAAYQIGDVERLLDVKSHTLRYWEKEMPLLQPRKDAFGRRVYSGHDITMLLRLKHLLYERHFTIEGAREQMLLELSGDAQDVRAIVDSIRSELVAVYFLSRRLRADAAAALDPNSRAKTTEETDL
jgi:DNA-binding transcriptional MerR regulator